MLFELEEKYQILNINNYILDIITDKQGFSIILKSGELKYRINPDLKSRYDYELSMKKSEEFPAIFHDNDEFYRISDYCKEETYIKLINLKEKNEIIEAFDIMKRKIKNDSCIIIPSRKKDINYLSLFKEANKV